MSDQPNSDYYISKEYDSKRRFISYWHQISETFSVKPSRVLEIGVGGGFVKDYLKNYGIDVTTLDVDAELKPDIVGDITHGTQFKAKQFDVVMACEILEHIPYLSVPNALKEISRIAEYAVISIPNNTPWYKIDANLPIFGRIKLFYEKRTTVKRNFSEDQRGHYWEIGTNDTSLKILKNEIAKYFEILKSYRVPEHPSHHFFLLKSTIN